MCLHETNKEINSVTLDQKAADGTGLNNPNISLRTLLFTYSCTHLSTQQQ